MPNRRQFLAESAAFTPFVLAGCTPGIHNRYPYIAYRTDLGNLFPSWSKDGGNDAFVARLGRPDLQDRLRQAVADKIGLLGGWDNVLISSAADDADRGVEDRRMGQYAMSIGRDPFDAAVALLVRSYGDVGMVGFAMSEANLERFLARARTSGAHVAAGDSQDVRANGRPHAAAGSWSDRVGRSIALRA